MTDFEKAARDNHLPEKKSLFGITSEYNSLITEIMESEGDLSDEIIEALAINKTDLTNKSRNYIAVINKQESESDFIDKEIKRLQSIKKQKQSLISRLKESISNAMHMYEINEITTGLNTIKFRKSEKVEIIDIEKLPASVITIKKEASKSDIKKFLKRGNIINGAKLITNYNLSIK